MTTRAHEEWIAPGGGIGTPVAETPACPSARRRMAARAAAAACVLLTGIGLAYLALLAWRMPGLVSALSWNGDAVSPAVLVESLGRVDGPAVLGDTSYAATLLFDWLTRGVPGHRAVWEAGPVVLALVGAGLAAWAAHRVGGRRAGVVTALIVTAASPAVLFTQVAPAFHGTTWFCVAFLAAALVFLAERPHLGRPRRWAWIVVVGLVAGLNLVSDPLLAPAGLAPLILAPLAARGTPGVRALFRSSAAAAGAALLTAIGILASLDLAGIAPRRTGGGIMATASAGDLAVRMRHLPETALTLVAPHGAAAVWLVAAAALALILGLRRGGPPVPGTQAQPPGRAYRAFWISSIALVAASYCVSGAVSDELSPAQSARYLVPVLYGVAALAGPWAARDDRRFLLGAAVAGAYAVVNVAGLAGPGMSTLVPHGKLESVADRVHHFLQSQGVSRGYAGYWDAPALRYRTGLDVAAVVQCRSGSGHSLCPDRHSALAGWYAPRAGRSFLLVDPTPRTSHVVSQLPPVARFGAPVAKTHFGEISVWIYPYDIAGRFQGPWSKSE